MGDRALSEAEYAVVLAALKFSEHVLRQRGGNWRKFHDLATALESRPLTDLVTASDRHTELVSTIELAEHLGCTVRHARRLAPRLGGTRSGRDWLIPRDALPDEETAC